MSFNLSTWAWAAVALSGAVAVFAVLVHSLLGLFMTGLVSTHSLLPSSPLS